MSLHIASTAPAFVEAADSNCPMDSYRQPFRHFASSTDHCETTKRRSLVRPEQGARLVARHPRMFMLVAFR